MGHDDAEACHPLGPLGHKFSNSCDLKIIPPKHFTNSKLFSYRSFCAVQVRIKQTNMLKTHILSEGSRETKNVPLM